MQKGKRVAPQIQRTRSDDLLASVFPHASACPETMVGDIVIPDHPLVREVMRDTLSEAMDIDGLIEILRGIASGTITCIAVDTPVPSLFAHELVNAMPYAFLDEAGAEARRARAVTLRRTLPDAVTEGAGRLDQAAIDTVREQLWPDIRDEHELHDLLLSLVVLPFSFLENASTPKHNTQHWPLFFNRLQQQSRAAIIELNGEPAWIAAERIPGAQLLWPSIVIPVGVLCPTESKPSMLLNGTEDCPAEALSPTATATMSLAQGWLQLLGPATAAHLAALAHLDPRSLQQSLLAMEMQGLAMRGVFEHPKPADDAPYEIEWCERRILQRIHRLTLRSLRQRTEPVPATVFMRWLLDWHHVAPSEVQATQLTGEEGVLAAIEQLEGFEAPAAEWERSLLPARVAHYDPRWLDNLCLAGIIGWGRLSPHPAWLKSVAGDDDTRTTSAPRRVIPTSAAPITFFLRESAEWLHATLAAKSIDESTLAQSLSPDAQQLRSLLAERGAAFTADLQRLSGLTKLETTTALWELATAGLASADGFDQLRAMMDPRRKSSVIAQTAAVSLRKRAAARTTAGRWSLLWDPVAPHLNLHRATAKHLAHASEEARALLIDAAKHADAALEAHARILLTRYGVLFRELLTRESNAPKWRDLLPMLRRLEARGEIRGGRFVTGAFGEQFALPEAADSLRTARSRTCDQLIPVAAADPLNLVGILLPGDRVAAIPGRQIALRNGSVTGGPVAETSDAASSLPPTLSSQPQTRPLWADLAAN
jgi:ATP-dependent Lhr-like helicase